LHLLSDVSDFWFLFDLYVQELLDRFAFRQKALKKGDYSEVCAECGQGRFTQLSIRQHLQREHDYRQCKA
jgi:hypothetical protein